jgi:hypothetical protein
MTKYVSPCRSVRELSLTSRFSQMMSVGSGAGNTVMGVLCRPNRRGVGCSLAKTTRVTGAMVRGRGRHSTVACSVSGVQSQGPAKTAGRDCVYRVTAYLRQQPPPSIGAGVVLHTKSLAVFTVEHNECCDAFRRQLHAVLHVEFVQVPLQVRKFLYRRVVTLLCAKLPRTGLVPFHGRFADANLKRAQ